MMPPCLPQAAAVQAAGDHQAPVAGLLRNVAPLQAEAEVHHRLEESGQQERRPLLHLHPGAAARAVVRQDLARAHHHAAAAHAVLLPHLREAAVALEVAPGPAREGLQHPERPVQPGRLLQERPLHGRPLQERPLHERLQEKQHPQERPCHGSQQQEGEAHEAPREGAAPNAAGQEARAAQDVAAEGKAGRSF